MVDLSAICHGAEVLCGMWLGPRWPALPHRHYGPKDGSRLTDLSGWPELVASPALYAYLTSMILARKQRLTI